MQPHTLAVHLFAVLQAIAAVSVTSENETIDLIVERRVALDWRSTRNCSCDNDHADELCPTITTLHLSGVCFPTTLRSASWHRWQANETHVCKEEFDYPDCAKEPTFKSCVELSDCKGGNKVSVFRNWCANFQNDDSFNTPVLEVHSYTNATSCQALDEAEHVSFLLDSKSYCSLTAYEIDGRNQVGSGHTHCSQDNKAIYDSFWGPNCTNTYQSTKQLNTCKNVVTEFPEEQGFPFTELYSLTFCNRSNYYCKPPEALVTMATPYLSAGFTVLNETPPSPILPSSPLVLETTTLAPAPSPVLNPHSPLFVDLYLKQTHSDCRRNSTSPLENFELFAQDFCSVNFGGTSGRRFSSNSTHYCDKWYNDAICSQSLSLQQLPTCSDWKPLDRCDSEGETVSVLRGWCSRVKHDDDDDETKRFSTPIVLGSIHEGSSCPSSCPPVATFLLVDDATLCQQTTTADPTAEVASVRSFCDTTKTTMVAELFSDPHCYDRLMDRTTVLGSTSSSSQRRVQCATPLYYCKDFAQYVDHFTRLDDTRGGETNNSGGWKMRYIGLLWFVFSAICLASSFG